jgi:RHS repeat-associated protein
LDNPITANFGANGPASFTYPVPAGFNPGVYENRDTETTSGATPKVHYGYNSLDQLTSVSDQRGLVTTYTYNAFGEVVTLDSPDTGTTVFSYDSGGNLISQTDARGITVTYTYDALNRLTAIDYPGSEEDVTLSYDLAGCTNGVGRLCRIDEAAASTAYQYDAAGNITTVTTQHATATAVIQYAYDAAGTLTHITYPSGHQVAYGLNTNGNIVTITLTAQGITKTITDGAQYLPFGPITQFSFGNGLVLNNSYNLDYRLINHDLNQVRSTVYGYDPAGNVTSIDDMQNGSLSQTFGYDSLDHLIQDDSAYGSLAYNYDAVGNRLSKIIDTASETYHYAADSQQLTSIEGVTTEARTYDAAGNMTSDYSGNRTFDYNNAGRLWKVYEGGQLIATYTYNAMGQRTRKVTATGTTLYHYDLGGNLIAETSETGETRREYVYMGSTPVAQIDVNGGVDTLTYLHTDHLGTPRRATSEAGDVVWSWDSDAFGKTAANDDPDNDGISTIINLRFPGQYYDAETQLHYNYYRYYDPSTGRYITSDPIGLLGGLNTYGYVSGNPLKLIDPFGLAGLIGPEYDSNNPNYHIYDFWTSICAVGAKGCTTDNVFDYLRRFPAPGYDGDCAIDGGNTADVPTLGGVTHLVDEGKQAIANITNPDHLLYPGKVVRNVEERNGWIYVHTFGDGIGSFGTLNELLKGVVWRPVDAQIRIGMREHLYNWGPPKKDVKCGCNSK